MKILVSEAVETIFHCHDWMQDGWVVGNLGKSMRQTEKSLYIKSDYFDETYKVHRVSQNHYVVFVDGLGCEGATVKEAVDKLFIGHESSSYFEFKI